MSVLFYMDTDMAEVEELSFREKTALISLLAVLLVYGGYFADLLAGTPERTLAAMLCTAIGVVVALVIIEVVFHVILATWDQADADAPADERDRLIASRSAAISHHVLTIGIVLTLGRILVGGAMQEAGSYLGVDLFEAANLLLAALVASEVTRYGAQIYFYRRGLAA